MMRLGWMALMVAALLAVMPVAAAPFNLTTQWKGPATALDILV